MIHYDSSGKLTKSVSKQLFKWDAPAPSCIHIQINTFMCSYLRFLCPANELLTPQPTTLRHRWNNPPHSPSGPVTWDGPCEPHLVLQAVSYDLAQMGTTPLTGASARPPRHEPTTNAEKKNDACSWAWLPHEGEKEPLGLRGRDHVHLLRSLQGATTHHHRPEMKNQLRPCRRCCDTFVKLLIVSLCSLMLRVDGMEEGGKSY